MLDRIERTWNSVYGVITSTVASMFPLLYIILAVIAGCLGSMLYGRISQDKRRILLRALGVGALLMGASEIWDGFFVLQTGQFETTGTFLVVIALLLGYVFGEALNLDRGIRRLGGWMHSRLIKRPAAKPAAGTAEGATAKPVGEGAPYDAEGFLLATLLCACSGSTLFYAISTDTVYAIPMLVKLVFCFAVIFLLSAIYGVSITFAAVPMAVAEGVILLVDQLWGHLLTPTLMNQFMLIGGAILVVTGLSLSLGIGKKLKAAHFIPAFFVPVLYGLVMLLVSKLTETK